jgi:kanamycin nucleotidyltransferase
MVARYSREVIVGGVYGSVARGTDTQWSDLELFFVVQNRSKIKGMHFIFRDIAVGYRVMERRALEEILTQPSLQWPFHMGVLSALKVLHGNPERVQHWLRLGQSAPAKKFRAALEASLPELIVESYGRILSCRERGNARDIGCAVHEVLFEMNQALCLLNQRWVTHDYYAGLVDAFRFPKLPDGYKTLVPALWSAREIAEIVPLAEEMVRNFWGLLAREGIKVAKYQNVDELPL